MPSRFLAVGTMIVAIFGTGLSKPIHAQGLASCVIDPTARSLTLMPAGSLVGGDLPDHAQVAELSGLTAAIDDDNQPHLWTLSNEERKLYPVVIPGLTEPSAERAAPVSLKPKKHAKELEGLTFARAVDGDSDRFFLVSEKLKKGGAVLSAAMDGKLTADPAYLSQMAGYDAVSDTLDSTGKTLADYFKTSDPNDGLEGIAYRADRNSLYLLKEKSPALLIEVDTALKSILSMTVLNCGSYKKRCSGQAPFPDTLPGSDKPLDFSGLAFDTARRKLWIVSDTGRSVFIFDPDDRTAAVFPLKLNDSCIEKAEGIAFLPRSAVRPHDALLVVNDQDEIRDTLLAAYWIVP